MIYIIYIIYYTDQRGSDKTCDRLIDIGREQGVSDSDRDKQYTRVCDPEH